jgi:hypothetical protein
MAGETNWMDLALMYWAQRGQNGDTPNFYNIPLTPEQKRWGDERWRLYQQGGSEQAKAVGSAGMQYLGGLQQGPSNFSFMSPAMKGQTFAGGFQMPKFNIGNFQQPQPGAGPARPPGAGTGPGAGVYRGPNGAPTSDTIQQPWAIGGGNSPGGGVKHRAEVDPGGDSPMYRDIYDIMTNGGGGPSIADRENWFPTTGGPRDPNRPGGGGANTTFDGGEPGGVRAGADGLTDDMKQRAAAAWQEYTAKYPDWKLRGASFAARFIGSMLGGPAGGAAANVGVSALRWIYKNIINPQQQPQQPTQPTAPPTGGGMPGDN